MTIDQLGRQTSYAYDSDGRLTTTTYPDSTTASTTYDADNNRLTSTDRAGHTTSYTYDADNRLTKTTYADQSFTQTVYDAAGRVARPLNCRSQIKIGCPALAFCARAGTMLRVARGFRLS